MKKIKLKYISTRLVARKSKIAFQEKARNAMDANGYVVIVNEGWVVKKFADGRVEKIKQLSESANLTILLD